MSNNFRKSGLEKSNGGTGFLKVLGLTLIIVSAAFLISLTSASGNAETTLPPDTTSSQTIADTTPAATTTTTTATTTTATTTAKPPELITDDEMYSMINVKFLPVNPYSRVGDKRSSTDYIVVHYIGWASIPSTAEQNWQYFKNLATTKATSVSANFIIGMDGEIIQCMPIDEIAYANYPYNEESISIECCHPDKNGKFSDATYRSLVKLVSWLCQKYNLGTRSVIRHFDVSGKLCPLYWAGDPGTAEYDRWIRFKDDLLID